MTIKGNSNFRIIIYNSEFYSNFINRSIWSSFLSPHLNKFGNEHPESKDALLKWYQVTNVADWRNYHDLKTTFNSIDAVGNNRYVFNIKGNQYRLIALIIFETRTLFILFVGTHEDFNKIIADKIEYKK